MKFSKYLLFTFLFFYIFLFSGCISKEKDKVSVNLVPLLTLGADEGDENYIIGGVADIEEDAVGNIYVLDFKFRMIRKYDRNGNFIKNIGKKGEGPGEIPQFTVDMELRNKKIYLLLINMVIIYDIDGNYLSSFKLPILPRYINVDKEGKIILICADEKRNKLIHVFNENGRYINSFGEPFQAPTLKLKKLGEKWLPSAVFHSKDDRLLLVNPFKYEIYEYKERSLERVLSRKSELYKSLQIEEDKGSWSWKGGGIPYLFEEDNYLIVFIDSLERGKYFEILDKRDFSFLGFWKIDVKGYLISYQQGGLYFSDDEGKIRKYKFEIIYSQ